MSRPRVLAIVGLTGTGKTELACAVARRVGAEVISADSMQVYRGLDLGTAKPSVALRREIPHHAVDVVAPDDPMTAGRYTALARRAAFDIQSRGRAIVLCGGTGLYARAFAHGLVDSVASDPETRHKLEAETTESLRRELESRDPAAARAIQPGDRVRTVRALEVMQLSGRRFSEYTAEHAFADRPFDVRWLAVELEREVLWRALRERTELMFRKGLVDEVSALRAQGYAEARPLQSIGYRQAGELLDGIRSESEAIDDTYLATRQYARRQRTWFNAEPACVWLDASKPDAALRRALQLLDP